MPFTADRRRDFETGVPIEVRRTTELLGFDPDELDAVVCCSSHAYSYPLLHESVSHLGSILFHTFGGSRAFVVAADGALTSAEETEKLDPDELSAHMLTNYFGSALLGSRLIGRGISIDIGTTQGYASNSMSISSWGWDVNGIQGAIDFGNTFSFTLAPQTGYYLDLDRIEFEARGGYRARWDNGDPGDRRVRVDYSFNDGATYTAGTTFGDLNKEWQSLSQDLEDQDEILQRTLSNMTIRFAGYTGGLGGRQIWFDNITVYGDVAAVPTPGAALLLLGGLGLEAWRRRRKA